MDITCLASGASCRLVKQKYEREMTQLRERVRASGAVDQQPHSIALEGGATAAAAAASPPGDEATVARNARTGYLLVRRSLHCSAPRVGSALFSSRRPALSCASRRIRFFVCRCASPHTYEYHSLTSLALRTRTRMSTVLTLVHM